MDFPFLEDLGVLINLIKFWNLDRCKRGKEWEKESEKTKRGKLMRKWENANKKNKREDWEIERKENKNKERRKCLKREDKREWWDTKWGKINRNSTLPKSDLFFKFLKIKFKKTRKPDDILAKNWITHPNPRNFVMSICNLKNFWILQLVFLK